MCGDVAAEAVNAYADRGVGSLTVLRSRSGALTKKIAYGPAGWQVTPFSAGAWYTVGELPIFDFADLARQLERVARDAHAAIVWGRPVPGVDWTRCRRLCDRAEHGDAVTFAPAPRRLLPLDMDVVPVSDCRAFAPGPC